MIAAFENSTCHNTSVYGIPESIAASKYPFATDVSCCNYTVTKTVEKLAACDKGSGEDTFLNGIIVQFDLTLSEKAWPEFQRYHFADFVSSQSTMHCITKFDVDKMCNQYVCPAILDILKTYIDEYKADPTNPDKFYRVIYNIPSGLRLTARITTNYRQLKTIYAQRRNHRLKPDWGEFCDWIEHLPLSWMITGKENTPGLRKINVKRVHSQEADDVAKALKENDGYCPCAILKTEDTKCMCKDFRDKIKDESFTGTCHCGLYEKTGE